MSMVFKFRMVNDENDNFIRDYEIKYDTNLLDFHNFICEDLEYDNENMSSFFTSNDRWEKLREFTLFDVSEPTELEEGPTTMESVAVGQIIHKNHDRLIYVFDMFADRAMFLELMATKVAEEGVEYPNVALSEAEAPDQFDAATVDSGSIFDDAMDEFNSFGGDDSYDDEY